MTSNYEAENAVSESPVCATESLNIALTAFLRSVRNSIKICCPVVIKEYDAKLRIVTVVPMVKYAYRSGEGDVRYLDRKPLKVHTQQNTFFGYTVDWGYYKGDTGLLIVCDNDITHLTGRKKYLDNNQSSVFYTFGSGIDTHYGSDYFDHVVGPSHSAQVHNYLSGFFIPQSWTDYNLFDVKECIEEEDRYFSLDEDGDYQMYIGTSLVDYGDAKYAKLDSCHIGVKNGIKDDDDRSSVVFAAGTMGGDKTAMKFQNDRLVVQQRMDSREYDIEIGFGNAYGMSASLEDSEGSLSFSLYNDPDEDDATIVEGDAILSGSSSGGEFGIEYRDTVFKTKSTIDILEVGPDEIHLYKGQSFHFDMTDRIGIKIGSTLMDITFGTFNLTTAGAINVSRLWVEGYYVNVNGSEMNIHAVDKSEEPDPESPKDSISIQASHWEYIDPSSTSKGKKPVGLRCPAFTPGPWKGYEPTQS